MRYFVVPALCGIVMMLQMIAFNGIPSATTVTPTVPTSQNITTLTPAGTPPGLLSFTLAEKAVYVEPDESAAVVTTLPRLAEIHVLARADGWYLIRLSDGRIGWLTDSNMDVATYIPIPTVVP